MINIIDRILLEGNSNTDCREEIGITVGLIDSLIDIARVLKPRLTNKNKNIKDALKDLRSDEDIKFILNYLK